MLDNIKIEDLNHITVVLDTNIWISESLFRKPLGAALLYTVGQSNGFIGLPEIVEDELIKNNIKIAQESIRIINLNYDKIDTMMGVRFSHLLPNDQELELSIKKRLTELDSIIKRMPFTKEHAKAALKRVNSGLPPNNLNNQQFKDSAIWEALFDICKDNKVYFVTKDKGFFENRDEKKGLAKNLLEECNNIGANISIYYDLSTCLEVLRNDVILPPIDNIKIGKKIDENIREIIQGGSDAKGFEIDTIIDSTILPFLTDKLNILALRFEIKYKLLDVASDNSNLRHDSVVIVHGDCFYNLELEKVTNAAVDLEKWQWIDEDGKIHKPTTHHIRGNIPIFNKRWSIYAFREPFENEKVNYKLLESQTILFDSESMEEVIKKLDSF